MYKFLKIVILFFLFQNETDAQNYIEIGGGYLNNYIINSSLLYDRSNERSGNSYGFSFTASKILYRSYVIRTGIQYIPKKYSIINIEKVLTSQATFTNSYLTIPIVIQAQIGKIGKLSFFSNIGGYLACLFFEKEIGIIPNVFNSHNFFTEDKGIFQIMSFSEYKETRTFNRLKNKRLDYGLTFGGSFYYKYNKRCSFFLEPVFYYSMVSFSKERLGSGLQKRNFTLGIFIGCMISLNKGDYQ